LMSIASAKLDLRNIKASDRIRAIEVLAKMHGWNASEKSKGDVEKFERIEVVIVNHSPARSSTDLLTAAEASAVQGSIWRTRFWQEPLLRWAGDRGVFKRAWIAPINVRFRGKADMTIALRNVR